MVAGLSLAFRGLLRSGRLCESRLDAFYHVKAFSDRGRHMSDAFQGRG